MYRGMARRRLERMLTGGLRALQDAYSGTVPSSASSASGQRTRVGYYEDFVQRY